MNNIILICAALLVTAASSAPVKDDDDEKPDIDDLITRLLNSEKLEKLAENIAERTADKLFQLQQSTPLDKADSVTTTTTKIKSRKAQDVKDDNSKEKLDTNDRNNEKIINETKKVEPTKKETAVTGERTTIDTHDAIQKFPTEDFSLKYKHFTTEPARKNWPIPTTTIRASDKEIVHSEETHNTNKEKSTKTSTTLLKLNFKAKPEKKSKEDTHIHDNTKESSDLSIDHKPFIRNKQKKNIKAKLRKKSKKHSSSESASEELTQAFLSGFDSSSSSHESKLALRTNQKRKDKTKKNKAKKGKIVLESIANAEISSEIEKNIERTVRTVRTSTSTSPAEKMTIPFGEFKDSEDSSESSESGDNEVSDTGASNKEDTTTAKTNYLRNAEINKNVKTSNENDNDHDDDDAKKSKGTESDESPKVDLKHMVRQENGKLYAFNQNSDYEEYHDKLSKLFKSVHKKKTKNSSFNENQSS